MSRALSVLEEFTPSSFVDRAALMLDEGKVFNKEWWEEEEAGEGVVPSGTTLYSTDGQYVGQLIYVGDTLKIVTPGGGLAPQPFMGGTYQIDAGGGKRWHVMLDKQGNITKSATSDIPTGGAGAAPSYMSTQPAQAAQFAHEQAMANLNAQLAEAKAVNDYRRAKELELLILKEQQDFTDEQRVASEKFTAEQNRLAEEAMLKRERLGVLQNLVEGFMQSQQRASEFVLSMQPDPFRFAAAAQGMPVMGTTPQEGYAEALTEFAQRPTPSMDPNAPLSAIEGGIESIMGQRFPLQPGLFGGMSGGGTVPIGPSYTARLVGEGPHGEGIAAGTAEVLLTGPTGATVFPLQRGLFDGGGVNFDVSSIYAGLAPLFASLGFTGIPQTARTPGGGTRFSDLGGYSWRGDEFLRQMGLRPNLIGMGGKTYYREGDELRYISGRDWDRFGFRPSDVYSLHESTAAGMGWEEGRPLTERPQFAPRPAGPMSTMPFAAIEPTTGVPLPAPYKIAYEMRRLRAENPDLYNIATSAYDYPNSPVMPGAFQTAMETYLPRGAQRRVTGLR